MAIDVVLTSSVVQMSFVDFRSWIVEMSMSFLEKARQLEAESLALLCNFLLRLNFMNRLFDLGNDDWSRLIRSSAVVNGDVVGQRLAIDVVLASSVVQMSFVDFRSWIVEMSRPTLEQTCDLRSEASCSISNVKFGFFRLLSLDRCRNRLI